MTSKPRWSGLRWDWLTKSDRAYTVRAARGKNKAVAPYPQETRSHFSCVSRRRRAGGARPVFDESSTPGSLQSPSTAL